VFEGGSSEAWSGAGRPGGDPSRWLAVVFWSAAAGAIAMTWIVRRTRLLPGEMATMRWVSIHLSDAFAVAGPVLDVAFTGLVPPALFTVFAAIVWRQWGRYPAAVFLLAGSVTGLTKLGDLARRPRPTPDLRWGEIVFGEGGYPSGHIIFAVMVFGMLAHLATQHATRPLARHLLQGSAVLVIMVTGPSRLVELDHWPADVIAGYLIATAGLAGAIWLEGRAPLFLAEHAPRLGEWLEAPLTPANHPTSGAVRPHALSERGPNVDTIDDDAQGHDSRRVG
jgi:undecaprenyl-diphosphatase